MSPSAPQGRMPRALQLRTQEGERMGAERELHGAIILDHLAARGQRRQRHLGLLPPRLGEGEERQRLAAAQPANPPERLPPVEPERLEGVRVGELLERRRRHARAGPDDRRSRRRAHPSRRRRSGRHARWRGPSPCAGRGGRGAYSPAALLLERAIPAAGVHADRPHLDTMRAARRGPAGRGRRSPWAGR